jgi:uncharacterized protein (TIGR00297 family)
VVDGPASLGAALIALAVGAGGGVPALATLTGFVAASAIAGRVRRRGRAEPARGLRHVLANGSVAAACGLAAGSGDVAAIAMVAALAAAASDTVGGEIGRAVGGRTRRITDGREVVPGVDGGVSVAGTTAAALAAAAVAAIAVATDLIGPRAGWAVAGAGFVGSLVDSLLGATLERRGLLDNEGVNLFSALAAAWVAAQVALRLGL